MNNTEITRRRVPGHNGVLVARLQGNSGNPAVVMTHSILSSAAMWDEQAALLAGNGWYVIRVDTIGHGESPEPATEKVTMDGLGADTIAVLDALGISQAHYVGLSLGAMSGFGLAINHGQRFLSLLLCSARVDTPPAFAAPWDDRIALAEQHNNCAPLAKPTIERWFGTEFVTANPAVASRFQQIATNTTVRGFVGCARAIQGMDYLERVAGIKNRLTMLVGANDGVLPDCMVDLQQRISASVLDVLPNGGHLPNIDQSSVFNAALMRHLDRVRQ
jgi:3-oxoadipate enol-lactonase